MPIYSASDQRGVRHRVHAVEPGYVYFSDCGQIVGPTDNAEMSITCLECLDDGGVDYVEDEFGIRKIYR